MKLQQLFILFILFNFLSINAGDNSKDSSSSYRSDTSNSENTFAIVDSYICGTNKRDVLAIVNSYLDYDRKCNEERAHYLAAVRRDLKKDPSSKFSYEKYPDFKLYKTPTQIELKVSTEVLLLSGASTVDVIIKEDPSILLLPEFIQAQKSGSLRQKNLEFAAYFKECDRYLQANPI